MPIDPFTWYYTYPVQLQMMRRIEEARQLHAPSRPLAYPRSGVMVRKTARERAAAYAEKMTRRNLRRVLLWLPIELHEEINECRGSMTFSQFLTPILRAAIREYQLQRQRHEEENSGV